MFHFSLGSQYKYDLSRPEFKTAFDFLAESDLMGLPLGWIELPNGVRASVQRYTTSPASELLFETHEKYIDVQYMLLGEEVIGVVSREGLKACKAYDKAEDITFYSEPELKGEVLVRTGDILILTPEDAHKPRCAAGECSEVRKIVVKVPV